MLPVHVELLIHIYLVPFFRMHFEIIEIVFARFEAFLVLVWDPFNFLSVYYSPLAVRLYQMGCFFRQNYVFSLLIFVYSGKNFVCKICNAPLNLSFIYAIYAIMCNTQKQTFWGNYLISHTTNSLTKTQYKNLTFTIKYATINTLNIGWLSSIKIRFTLQKRIDTRLST